MRRILAVGSVCGAVLFFIVCAARHNLLIDAALYQMAPEQTVIIIDAGHGGEDGGAVLSNGGTESQINLQVALRMEQLLAFSGFDTFMIRSDDISVYSEGCETLSEKKISDLKNRVQTIGTFNNGLLVSIHQNQYSDPKYSGAQVFYAQTEGSRDLAQQMQTYLKNHLDNTNNRKCKPADSVYLLKNISCTGVLVECGFLSNPREAELLQSADYQKKLACILCGALNVYLEGSMKDEV